MSKTALITGASSGIGAAFARALAREGYDLVLVARRAERLRALADEIQAERTLRIEVLPADLSLPEAPWEIRQALDERGIHVDLLVNNAGLGLLGAFAETEWEREREIIDLNIRSLTAMCKVFLPPMLERKAGAIINVASTGAFQAVPYFAVYAASKSYVLSFSEAMAEEVASQGIKVVCLCPGPTVSEFMDKATTKPEATEKLPMMTAEQVVAQALDALRAGSVVRIPGVLNAIGAFGSKVLPRKIIRQVSGAIFKSMG